MVTRLEWEEFLYNCDLGWHLWLHVDRAAEAYLRGEISEDKLRERLAEVHTALRGELAERFTQNQEAILRFLRMVLREGTKLDKWIN